MPSTQDLLNLQFNKKSEMFGCVDYTDEAINCQFCKCFHGGPCNTIENSVNKNTVEDQLLTRRFKCLWEDYAKKKKHYLSATNLCMTINGVKILDELQTFIISIDKTPLYRGKVDEEFFDFVDSLKKGEVQVDGSCLDGFNDFLADLRNIAARENDCENILHHVSRLEKKVKKTLSNSNASSAPPIEDSVVQITKKTVEAEKNKVLDILEVETQPMHTEDMDFRSLSPASTVSLSSEGAKKRPAEDQPRGLVIKKLSRGKKIKGGEFIGSDTLVSMSFPCHESADYILGFKPDCSKKGAKSGAKTPKAGVARGYSKGCYSDSDDTGYSTVYFRYCSEQKKNLLEEIMLRSMGTGHVPLINPDVDMDQLELESWCNDWVKKVQAWAVKFVEGNGAGFIRLAESWVHHAIECKKETIEQAEEKKQENENKRMNLQKAIDTMNFM